MADEILYTKAGQTGILTINKPKANQLSHAVFEGIRKTLSDCETDRDLRAVIITGSGDKIFSAGADLSQGFGDYNAVDFLKRGQDVWNKIEDFPRPVIAAINGHALGGGCELALACHFRFMKKGAKLGLTETNLGIIPGYGGTLRLPRYIGGPKALEYILLGEQIPAEDAYNMGLINHLSDEGKTVEDAMNFAGKLAARPPLAVSAVLKIFSASRSLSPEMHLKMEREKLASLFGTKDTREGMTAFMEKRQPVFKGE